VDRLTLEELYPLKESLKEMRGMSVYLQPRRTENGTLLFDKIISKESLKKYLLFSHT